MPEVFITWPDLSLDSNDLPTSLTGAIFSTTKTISGLTNDTAYRTFVIQNPSPAFTPSSSGALTETFYRRVNATSTSFTTATWTGVDISDVTESKLLIAIFGRTGNNGTVNIAINGGSPQSMTSSTGASTRVAFIIVDKPAGSVMDVVSVSSSGNWGGTGDATIAIWGISGGTITDSEFDMKSLTSGVDTTYSVNLSVPSNGMVFVVAWPRADATVVSALSNVDIDSAWEAGTGGNERFLGSRSSLSANPSYSVSITYNRSGSQLEMAFGAIVVS